MNGRVIFVALAVLTVSVFCATGPNQNADQVDFDAVFKSLHLDFCNAKCAQTLKPALVKILKMVDVYDDLNQLCSAYDESLSCAKKSFCIKNQVYTTITSGIEDLCKSNKHQYIQDHQSCIKPKIDGVSQNCDSKCNFVKEFAAFSHDPQVQKGVSILQTLDRLDGVCKSLNCYLPCVRAGLDGSNCTTAGGVITSAILRPFYIASEGVSKLTPNIQDLISKKLPQSCVPLINATVLNDIAGPSDVQKF